jgi:predicted O-methyltransferase YrrM
MPTEIINPAVAKYAEAQTSAEPAALQKINRDTHANVLMPRMLSGHVQGRLLAMISQMIKPEFVLEIGTYTGYSAVCFAEGLKKGGKIITIDRNEDLSSRMWKNIVDAGIAPMVDLRIGNALEIIPGLNYPFDLVFIDADKVNYANYYDLVIDKVRSGGFILADNVLWSGKVIGEKPDKDTKAILDFNAKVTADPRVENVMLTVRDGLMLVRKKS